MIANHVCSCIFSVTTLLSYAVVEGGGSARPWRNSSPSLGVDEPLDEDIKSREALHASKRGRGEKTYLVSYA